MDLHFWKGEFEFELIARSASLLGRAKGVSRGLEAIPLHFIFKERRGRGVKRNGETRVERWLCWQGWWRAVLPVRRERKGDGGVSICRASNCLHLNPLPFLPHITTSKSGGGARPSRPSAPAERPPSARLARCPFCMLKALSMLAIYPEPWRHFTLAVPASCLPHDNRCPFLPSLVILLLCSGWNGEAIVFVEHP